MYDAEPLAVQVLVAELLVAELRTVLAVLA